MLGYGTKTIPKILELWLSIPKILEFWVTIPKILETQYCQLYLLMLGYGTKTIPKILELSQFLKF